MGRKKRNPIYEQLENEGDRHVIDMYRYVIHDTHAQATNMVTALKRYLKKYPDDDEMKSLVKNLERANNSCRDRRLEFWKSTPITMDETYDPKKHKEASRYFFYLHTLMLRMKDVQPIVNEWLQEELDDMRRKESEGL